MSRCNVAYVKDWRAQGPEKASPAFHGAFSPPINFAPFANVPHATLHLKPMNSVQAPVACPLAAEQLLQVNRYGLEMVLGGSVRLRVPQAAFEHACEPFTWPQEHVRSS